MMDGEDAVMVVPIVPVMLGLVVCPAAWVTGATSAKAMGRRRDQRTEVGRIEWLMGSSFFSRRGVRNSETMEKKPKKMLFSCVCCVWETYKLSTRGTNATPVRRVLPTIAAYCAHKVVDTQQSN